MGDSRNPNLFKTPSLFKSAGGGSSPTTYTGMLSASGRDPASYAPKAVTSSAVGTSSTPYVTGSGKPLYYGATKGTGTSTGATTSTATSTAATPSTGSGGSWMNSAQIEAYDAQVYQKFGIHTKAWLELHGQLEGTTDTSTVAQGTSYYKVWNSSTSAWEYLTDAQYQAMAQDGVLPAAERGTWSGNVWQSQGWIGQRTLGASPSWYAGLVNWRT